VRDGLSARVSDHVLAVLILGQFVVTADEAETRSELEAQHIPVDCKPVEGPGFPPEEAIRRKYPAESRDSLKQTLSDEEARRSNGLSDLIERWTHFREFLIRI